jgi:inorganic pyrophosphatase
VLDQKERSDEEIDGDAWLAFPGAKEQVIARRDAQRRRKAERGGQEKKSAFGDADWQARAQKENTAFDRAVEAMPEGKDKEAAKKGHGQAVGSCGHRIRGCRCPSRAHSINLTLDIICEDCDGQAKKAERAAHKCEHDIDVPFNTCDYGCKKPVEKKASGTKEIQQLLNDSDIPGDIYFFTDGKERATVCVGDWHTQTEEDIAIQFGLSNWDNFERPDDTEIGKPLWATKSLHPRRKGLSKKASIASLLRQARNATHEHPTEAQRRAGNYAMGTFRYKGLTIKIENPKDSIRRGEDKHGKAWESRIPADYGFFKGSEAIDGDAVDVFVGPDLESDMVVAIDQIIDGKYDETKFMVAVTSQAQAEKLYLSAYQKGWKLGDVSTTTVQQLKEWLKDGDHKKPFKGQMVKVAAWWSKRKPLTTDPTALKFLPKNVKDLLAVTFGSKWAPKKEELRRKAR